MKHYFTLVLIVVVLPVLSWVYYTVEIAEPVDRVFLSISTFLYSIFTGFFISRQASRFNKVRETVTKFDGLMSNMYRTSGHISATLQKDMGEVIKAHYEKIFQTKQWNYHFEHKSTTLSSIHRLLDKHIKEDKVTKLSNQSIGAIVKSLGVAQDVRKSMLALNRERDGVGWCVATSHSQGSVCDFSFVGNVYSVPTQQPRLHRRSDGSRISSRCPGYNCGG